MKKFLPLFLVALVATATVSAQGLRYGITGAMNVANYAMEVEGISFNPDSRIGFRAGFRMEMDAPFIYDGFYFDAEALLSAKGAKFDSSLRVLFLVPITLRFLFISAIAICLGKVMSASSARLAPILAWVCSERIR